MKKQESFTFTKIGSKHRIQTRINSYGFVWANEASEYQCKKYIIVIIDDYYRYTWVYSFRTKDEAPDMIINFINQVQRSLKAQILKIQTDNGSKFKNENFRSFYAKLGIVHHTSIARTPQQNGVVERRNRTFIEAARTMLIFSKTLEFLWAEAIEYYAPSTSEMSNNFAANTLDVENTLLPSSIIVEDSGAPQIVTSLDVAELDGNTIMHSFKFPDHQFETSDGDLQGSSNKTSLDSELMQSCVCRHAIKVKWLWKNKTDAENTVIQNKSCLIAKGYSQQEGIDFEESVAPDSVPRSCLYVRGLRDSQELYNIPYGCEDCIPEWSIERRSFSKKHGMEKCDIVTTPMATAKIDADLHGTPTYQTKYRSMIRGLMHLTHLNQDSRSSKPNMLYAPFQSRDGRLMRYFAFEGHLEELHVTWAHLEKKRTRLRTCTNISQDNVLSGWRWRHIYNVTPSHGRTRRRHKIPRQRQST
ncbi:retrovirus-related pol polyprotein from transposon TNT 1-94 [Tanacetum coccineum]